jgi:4-hydroxy-3-polyprenylbenzoate decarboxylase
MPFKDLRSFLEKLKQEGQFLELKKEMEDGFEVSALGWELSDRGGGPGIMFKIKGYDTPVVANVHGTLQRNAMALGLEPADTMEKKLTGNQVDLKKLPIVQWNRLDGGPYITLPNVITRDQVNPKFGRNNGMYRAMVHDETTTGIMCVATQDIGIHVARARAAGMKAGGHSGWAGSRHQYGGLLQDGVFYG